MMSPEAKTMQALSRPARPPRPAPAPDTGVPPGLAVMAAEFEAKEHGSFGEFITVSSEPPQPPRESFPIPPPPWSPNYIPELDPDYEPPAPGDDTETTT